MPIETYLGTLRLHIATLTNNLEGFLSSKNIYGNMLTLFSVLPTISTISTSLVDLAGLKKQKVYVDLNERCFKWQ